MKSTEIAAHMIEYSNGNVHDINHFLKVFAYARIIGESENMGEREQQIVEISAIVHDIACPLCREKYGNTNGKYQEAEGGALTRDFLVDKGLQEDVIERVAFLVSHHHTYTNIDGMDYQILIEADYLVNADESSFSRENIENTMTKIFKTKMGKCLLESIYLRPQEEDGSAYTNKPCRID